MTNHYIESFLHRCVFMAFEPFVTLILACAICSSTNLVLQVLWCLKSIQVCWTQCTHEQKALMLSKRFLKRFTITKRKRQFIAALQELTVNKLKVSSFMGCSLILFYLLLLRFFFARLSQTFGIVLYLFSGNLLVLFCYDESIAFLVVNRLLYYLMLVHFIFVLRHVTSKSKRW